MCRIIRITSTTIITCISSTILSIIIINSRIIVIIIHITLCRRWPSPLRQVPFRSVSTWTAAYRRADDALSRQAASSRRSRQPRQRQRAPSQPQNAAIASTKACVDTRPTACPRPVAPQLPPPTSVSGLPRPVGPTSTPPDMPPPRRRPYRK